MTEIANNKKRLQEWIDKNLEFCIKEYGKENIVRFAVHLDEKKHRIFIAFLFLLLPDGRLSAGDWMKTGKQLEEVKPSMLKQCKNLDLKEG